MNQFPQNKIFNYKHHFRLLTELCTQFDFEYLYYTCLVICMYAYVSLFMKKIRTIVNGTSALLTIKAFNISIKTNATVTNTLACNITHLIYPEPNHINIEPLIKKPVMICTSPKQLAFHLYLT